jgi:uncharacterized protein
MKRLGSRRSYAERWISPSTGRSAVLLRVAGSYALLASAATGLVVLVRDGAPWSYPEPLLTWGPLVGTTLSAALGIAFAVLLIGVTRVAVTRFGWARQLHRELRPVARDLSLGGILVVAGLSSLGEELLFRGLLTPLLGLPLSALLFGFAHQIRGSSRWVWVGWATIVGLALGGIFVLTGSLVGPLLAHAIVNAVNLTYLRDHDPDTRPLSAPS